MTHGYRSARAAPALGLGSLPGLAHEPVGTTSLPPLFTWVYIVWSIVPVLIAVQFSFNASRSRTVWQGFSTRWYWGDPSIQSGMTRLCAALSSRA